MIQILNFNNLDAEKYRHCITNAAQNTAFCGLDYLKCLNGNQWNFLVYDDYEAVMPVYFKRKLGIKFVICPPFVNQMGIFSHNDDSAVNFEIYKIFTAKYRILYYPFNYKNTGLHLDKRLNYRLRSAPYEVIKQNYSAHRRRNVRLRDSDLQFREVGAFAEVESFYRAHCIGIDSKKMWVKYLEVPKNLEKANYLKIFALYRREQLISLALLAEMPSEIGLLALVNDKEKITANDPSILIDQIIQKYCAAKNLNFFGSNIDAVAEFYRRFGAQEERYPYIFNSR